MGTLLLFVIRDRQTDIVDHSAGEITTTQSDSNAIDTGAVEPVQSDTAAKTDAVGNQPPQASNEAMPPSIAPPEDVSLLDRLNAYVTAQMRPDGNSIELLFFLEGPGWFTIQEKRSGSWVTTDENVYYSGTGSLPAGEMTQGEDTGTIRALKIENGSYTAVSREFTITRSEVTAAGGIKTYSPTS